MNQLILPDKTLQRLGLSTQPFNSPDNSEQLFHYIAIDMLVKSIAQQLSSSQNTQFVIGESGSGKSCFCRRLVSESPAKLAYHFYRADKDARFDRILSTLLSEAPNESIRELETIALRAAKEVFRQLRDDLQPVLLVDDAQLLTASALRMLFRFQDAISKQNLGVLKLALVGERKLQETWSRLGQTAPADETVTSSLLRPLNRQEIGAFLDFRFSSAGASNHPFTKKQLRRIQQESSGLPGKIEQISCNLLSRRNTSSRQLLAMRPVAVAAMLLLTVTAVIAYLLFGVSEHADTRLKTEASGLAQHTPAPPGVDDTAAADIRLNTAVETDSTDINNNISDVADQLPLNNTDTATTTTENNAIDSAAPQSVKDEEWLNQWPENYYVIQLLGSWQNEKLVELASSLTLEKHLIIRSSTRNERAWYTLLYGVFPDRESARAAIEQLPAELRAGQPWPRPISTLSGT